MLGYFHTIEAFTLQQYMRDIWHWDTTETRSKVLLSRALFFTLCFLQWDIPQFVTLLLYGYTICGWAKTFAAGKPICWQSLKNLFRSESFLDHLWRSVVTSSNLRIIIRLQLLMEIRRYLQNSWKEAFSVIRLWMLKAYISRTRASASLV